MESQLHQEINRLEQEIMKMFAMTEEALEASVQALLERNDELAQKVIDGDDAVNQLEVKIEELILHIVARWQPVARDLRFILGCSKVANELERLGDQATNIAERALMLNQRPKLKMMGTVRSLSEVVLDMYQKSITAFSNLDCDTAAEVCRQDNRADVLNVKIIRELIDYMGTDNRIIERPVHTIIVSNSLERVGDLSTNIAEEVFFIIQGINVKHSTWFDSPDQNQPCPVG
ncbi:MAG: phosphate signaling complex protein PhoU [Desulfohalobiaceae bacterium]|nr:phosphate signaling complex protein PhoU [Desulfohalobiaceae bacterium]